MSLGCGEWGLCLRTGRVGVLLHIVNVMCPVKRLYDNNAQGKITKARSP